MGVIQVNNTKQWAEFLLCVFISPVLQRGGSFDGLCFFHFPASGAGLSAAGWKVGRTGGLFQPRVQARG